MSEYLNLVKSLKKQGKHILVIEWLDGAISRIKLCQLQRVCPCAACVDENTGKRIIEASSIPDDLEAKRVRNVGRYGLQIDFVSGCSHGIFSYDALRNILSSESKVASSLSDKQYSSSGR